MNITKRLKISFCFFFILNVLIVHIQCQFDEAWDIEIRKRNPFEKYGESLGKSSYRCGIKPNYNVKKETAPSARIINGKSRTSKDYPWTAQIYNFIPSGPGAGFFISSGTIISNMAIISCRHCICISLTDVLRSYATKIQGGKKYYENLPTSALDFPAGTHTCVISAEGSKSPYNQNRNEEFLNQPENIVNYHIASDPFPGDPTADTDSYFTRYRQNIKAYIYEYDPFWIYREARDRMDKDKPVGTEAYYDKNADISLIIDDNKLHLKPQISSPVCLPVPESFHAQTKSGDVVIDVVVAGRGRGYEQHSELNPATNKMETYTTCYTNQGMVRKEFAKSNPEPHIFIPCKDYERFKGDASKNKNMCIPFGKARVNTEPLDVAIFKYMSTDTRLMVAPDGDSYDITLDDDSCNELWKSAEEYILDSIKPDNYNLLAYVHTRGEINHEPDILIVVEKEETEQDWKKIFEEWTYKGTGPGVRCFNFKGLAANGICQTESTKYRWGFCSRSCIFNDFDVKKGISPDEVELEMAEFKYYDDPASSTTNSLRLTGDREDNSKAILFKIGLRCLK